MATKEQQAEFRTRQKEKGLCVKCKEPRLKDYCHCQKHHIRNLDDGRKAYKKHKDKIKLFLKTRKQKLKKDGKCVDCAIELDREFENGIRCINCGPKHNGRMI